jgi:hypothetical protein
MRGNRLYSGLMVAALFLAARGFAVGAAEGAAFGGAEGFTRTALIGGSPVDAVMAGWKGGLMGAAIGGPLGAIFHEICFTDGTPVHKAIGESTALVQVAGDRLMTLGTLATAHLPGDDPTGIDPENCRLVRLRTTKPFGSDNVLDAELIRHLTWLEENNVVEGGVFRFIVPELGIDGPADVVAVEPCPPIEAGRGRVITAKFTTAKGRVLEIRLVGEAEPLEPTPPHRIKSLDRGDWIPAEQLRIGEKLQTKTGKIVTVESIGAKLGLHRVHNFEVEGEHHFFVGTAGVLVHNAYAGGDGVDFSHPDLPARNGQGPTNGIFNDAIPLVSGSGGGDGPVVFASRLSELSEDAQIALTHVEGHAAAEMVKGERATRCHRKRRLKPARSRG